MTNKKNEVKVFTFNESNQPIRVKVVNGEPWFVAKDVCRVLEHSNHKMAIKSLDEDEVSSVYLIDIMGRQQETKVVSESGLYSLIFQSRKRGYGVCCMLVDCAKENRAKGITRPVRDRAAEMDALRQELMLDFDGREG